MTDGRSAGRPPPVITDGHVSYAGYPTRRLTVAGAGQTIVLLHGFGHPSDCWRPVLTRYAADGQRAVAVDLPGFGAAGPLHAGPALPQLDRFVDAVVDAHADTGPVVVMGNSLGGLLAVRAADAGRALPLGGAVALNAAGFGWTPLFRFATGVGFRPMVAIAVLPAPAGLRAAIGDRVAERLLYGRRDLIDPAMVRLMTAQIRHHRDARGLLGVGVRIVPEVNAIPPVGDLACPAVIVHGRRDRIVSARASRSLHDAIPGSRLVMLPFAGHCPHLDEPDRVATTARELCTAERRRRA